MIKTNSKYDYQSIGDMQTRGILDMYIEDEKLNTNPKQLENNLDDLHKYLISMAIEDSMEIRELRKQLELYKSKYEDN